MKVQKHPDPFGNQAFSADKYKTFDRAANRFGHPYADYNHREPDPLQNPTLNVNDEQRAFEAVDAVGLGALTHYRVVNKLTNEYVTKQIHREDARQIAAELNHEYQVALHEAIENPNSSGQGYDASHAAHPLHKTCSQHGFGYSHSTPIHQRDGSVVTHHTWAHGEHKVGAHEGSSYWTSKVSSASGHSTSGEGSAALAKHLKGKAQRHPELKLGEDLNEAVSRKHFQQVATFKAWTAKKGHQVRSTTYRT